MSLVSIQYKYLPVTQTTSGKEASEEILRLLDNSFFLMVQDIKMKVVFLVAFLLITAHCARVREFHYGIYHRLSLQQLRKFRELCICRKPPVNRRTTVGPMPTVPPTVETEPPLTLTPPVPLTGNRRGDS
ncbi:endotoxic shock protective protein U9-ORF-like [Tamandua tetradactyla]|uniref:endotoxic shock protective protein U9-ORF-like n=1 Tax=Tamandua tetradactyla TaxID=48850 RepID=UPI004053DF8D